MKSAKQWMEQLSGASDFSIVCINQQIIKEIQHDAFKSGQEECMKWVSPECKRQVEHTMAIRNNLNSPLNEPS